VELENSGTPISYFRGERVIPTFDTAKSIPVNILDEYATGHVRVVLLLGDARLQQVCNPVTEFSEETQQTVADLVKTLVSRNGLGLAAPQVGKLIRVLVVLESVREGQAFVKVLINPEIVHREGEYIILEGCLSIPGARGTVKRAERIWVTSQDATGVQREEVLSGLAAAVVQHEMDHLDGKLFTTHLSPFLKGRAMQQHRKVMSRLCRKIKKSH
jgi:peptide deformylase